MDGVKPSESRNREAIIAELKKFLDELYGVPGFNPHPQTLVEMGIAADRILALSETENKKVYVVIGGWDYEGHSEPTGIYSSKEKAEAAKVHARANHNYDDLDILEYDLDVGELENDPAAGERPEGK